MSLDMTVMLICGVLGAVCGVYHFIDSRGGWSLYWAEFKRKK